MLLRYDDIGPSSGASFRYLEYTHASNYLLRQTDHESPFESISSISAGEDPARQPLSRCRSVLKPALNPVSGLLAAPLTLTCVCDCSSKPPPCKRSKFWTGNNPGLSAIIISTARGPSCNGISSALCRRLSQWHAGRQPVRLLITRQPFCLFMHGLRYIFLLFSFSFFSSPRIVKICLYMYM